MILLLIRQIVLGLSIAAPIGPINIEIIRRGINQGFWPSLLVGAGGMSADLIIMFLMYHGLSGFLTLEEVQLALLVFGAGVLSYTGIQGLQSQPQLSDPSFKEMREQNEKSSLLGSYLTGASIAAFNPLNLLFWLGIYGSVLSSTFQNDNPLHAFYINSAVFIGIGLWNLNLSLSVFFGKRLLKKSILKGICLAASLFLVGCGLYFAFKAIGQFRTVIGI
ncbi:LysE family translocator [Salipaludibacillus sp. CUR1]|uniref:LysE family translocator n=1 Tax=Salipaludibacillus sp. CUR1 TaxID=2820003 RepID=UPI001E40894E|nr:LysE family translocator [Salipaludibacillus sp. CUR1]MCE7792565.1 LysE family translocator [Salipaludibacillus sp. CUR1]